ncbi:NUDIX domain-containing protein [Roseospirillum parvum]|uniref:ADP-ribose pyrophosphatase n=1 Tax=Roseospirillum parvum TaxID=83401 RepID=A0A1G7U871_9PROT|nr:NUDIX domain-containing protein [Roseospirillum parvum]SDG43776.1 ADP-ribose pyrophosphatase [Roseospirillum parvum]
MSRRPIPPDPAPPEGVEHLGRELLHDGFLPVEKRTLRHRLFAGGWSQPLTREVVRRGVAVAVIPYDPVRRRVVLIEQFRIGAQLADQPAWQVEVVAGLVEPGEDHAAVARRELQEEAGLEALDLEPVQGVVASPGAMDETVWLYAARVDAEAAQGIHGLDHEGEDIRVFTVSLDELADLVDRGGLTNSTTLIAALWLLRHHGDLDAAWTG